ncbi:MAG: ribosome silencing factor [Taibaiella sp.]|nr:ribosome silencing factor [Taibaiella sp.]
MEKVISALQERKKSPARLTKSSKLFKTIINAVKEKKADEVISLDLKKIDEAVADYFVLCEAKSHIQVKAIADYVVEQVEKECGERPFHRELGDTWTLVDYVNIVVHVFQHEQRLFYNLESLWEDAPRTEH